MAGKYDVGVDRESAYELLRERADELAASQEEKKTKAQMIGAASGPKSKRRSTRQTPSEAMLKSTLRSVGTSLGRALVRGLLGSFRR